uniref:Uncharacterized protein n=1 Tax=Megaselia scalaris TaxID=36166 RepID=T1GXD0_MEGSC
MEILGNRFSGEEILSKRQHAKDMFFSYIILLATMAEPPVKNFLHLQQVKPNTYLRSLYSLNRLLRSKQL